MEHQFQKSITERFDLFDEPRFFVWVLFCQTNDVMVAARDRELRQFRLNHEYAATLTLVDFLKQNASPAEIARRRFRQPHTISNLLTNMEREGLILKTQDQKRRNQVRVKLTAKGRKALADSLKFVSVDHICGVLTSTEQYQMTKILWRLQCRALDELYGEYQPSPSKEELENQVTAVNLFRLLRRTNDIMVRVREKELSHHGLSIKTASALRVIELLGDTATPASIARWRFRHPNSISNQLIRLEQHGLVRRKPSQKKKNQVNIRLTKRGREALSKSMERPSVIRMFADLEIPEIKQFGIYLEQLKNEALRELETTNGRTAIKD